MLSPTPLVQTLRKRCDFLALNAGKRWSTPGFVLLGRSRCDDLPTMRIGYTVTKKIGNAVTRNRLKRRFRALVQQTLAQHGATGWDYVMIGRTAGLKRDYAILAQDLQTGLNKLKKFSKQPHPTAGTKSSTCDGSPKA